MEKLPKQWNNWTKSAGLKTQYNSKLSRKYENYYFEGHGYYWRLSSENFLQRSCFLDDFDKWSNSKENEILMDASSKDEFVKLVKFLLIGVKTK